MNLGENIYRFRSQKNMSQGDLADSLNVSRQSVSKWENNSATPELEKLIKMSEVFGITLDELVSGVRSEPTVQTVCVEKPRIRFTQREIAGIVFWFFAALMILVYAMSGEGFAGLLPAVPFLICGTMCYASKLRHLALWCVWVFALPIIFIPLHAYIYQPYARMIILAIWIPMLITTVWCLRNDPVHLTKRVKLLLISGYFIWFGYITYMILHELHLVGDLFPGNQWLTMWVDSTSYLLFVSLFSITTRLLKRK